MKQILALTRKELYGYFGSLLATIFLGAFLAAVLFVFFTIEGFFARGIADVRPMFQWMPVLLIFLLAALTMRQWSEEQRSGTLEVLLTLPVHPVKLVLGKFLAVMAMIVVALALTLPLPLMAAIIGNLDWGPVAGGYLAALLMACAYAAIGLYVSSKTDNSIVSLIVTVLLGGVFYLVGTSGVTNLFGGSVKEILWSLGTGSRFESIERGVIDLRDLMYYLSICALFLLFNVLSLDAKRQSRQQKGYRRNALRTASLLTLNLVLLNVWLHPLQGLRLDLTAQKEYTISAASRGIISNLGEPLLLRAYISEQTHPLLAPLAPQVSDMFREYEIASGGKITAEVLDPLTDPEIEAEANQTYGIQPTPFQIQGRNEASIINSYFDILVRYGDQSVVLNFQDMIDVQQTTSGVQVRFKNLEYSLTSAIKKAVYGFQSVDSVLASLTQPVQLTLYVTPATLPDTWAGVQELTAGVISGIQAGNPGKLDFLTVDPTAAGAVETANSLYEKYGISPLSTSFFSAETYYFHMVLVNGDKFQVIYPPAEVSEASIRGEIESALKRTSSGFLKKVGLWVPPQTTTTNMFGQAESPISSYKYIQAQLAQQYEVVSVDLSSGEVPADVDSLVIIAPEGLGEIEYYAIDQFLMKGGSLVIASSDHRLASDPFTGMLSLEAVEGGIAPLLKAYGIDLTGSLVLDRQNAPFPVVVSRDVGGQTIQEIQAVDYPFFVDVRAAQMSSSNLITSGLPLVSMNWATPVVVDETASAGRSVETLASSSANAWLSTDNNIQPDYAVYPEVGFPIPAEMSAYPLAVAIQGSFASYFAGQAAPEKTDGTLPSPLESSPASARLVVLGSSGVVDDFAMQISARLTQDYYINNLQFVQNAVDWGLEDTDLLSIRSRGTAAHVLMSLSDQQKSRWEITTYVVSLLLLACVYIYGQTRKREQPMRLVKPAPVKKQPVQGREGR